MTWSYLVHVTDDPAIGNGPLDRNVLFLVVANAVDGVVDGPVVIGTMVPCSMVLIPAVAAGVHALGRFLVFAAEIVDVPGVDMVSLGRHLGRHHLVPDGLVPIHLEVGIGKATNTRHGTKVVVKGAILCVVELATYTPRHGRPGSAPG